MVKTKKMAIFYKLTHWYFSKDALPYWCVFIFDCLVVIGSGLLCYILDHGAVNTSKVFLPLMGTLIFYLIPYIIGFRVFHTYSGVMRYTSFADIHRVALANLIGVGTIAILRYFFNFDNWLIPIRMRELGMTFVLATGIMWSVRMIVKYMYEYYKTDQDARGVFIYGVKTGGLSIARALSSPTNTTFKLKGFISDAEDIVGKRLMGVKVYENNDKIIKLMEQENANTLFVSPLKREKFVKSPEMVDRLIENGIAIYTMDTATKWDGKSDISTAQLKEIDIEDLLPRDEILIDLTAIEELLKDKSILITGSAGSIGSEIVRQIAEFGPRQLVLVDQAETPQHDCRLMMASQYPDIKAETIVTSICNKRHMEIIFRKYHPDYVFHAAAYKHVPMMEDNPCESIQNNVEGTKIMADLAVKYGVKKFVMISTDKAVNPTNVMGCSKRICEIYVQSLDQASKEKKVSSFFSALTNKVSFITNSQMGSPSARTQFVTTRFGNVLGSNGSVIPLFREQIKNGGPVTVTDERIVRFFMLIPEACKLVLEAGTKGNGGEIFVFDMGKPVKISDLAKRM
ncbi:MAG: polysaccharide biosynthesis protein, partial [Muribaculaceae bacterium]|nr:polysaccharide biosynthesis protein [Muribaculaceae bacterium]